VVLAKQTSSRMSELLLVLNVRTPITAQPVLQFAVPVMMEVLQLQRLLFVLARPEEAQEQQ